jgi:CBS domain-containing protein
MNIFRLVGEIMHKGVLACQPQTPMGEVVRVLSDSEHHTLVVVNAHGELLGILSHMDVLPYYGQDLQNYQAKDVMTPRSEICVVTPSMPIAEAVRLMAERRIHHLVVTEEGSDGLRPVGIVSTADIIREMRGSRWIWLLE